MNHILTSYTYETAEPPPAPLNSPYSDIITSEFKSLKEYPLFLVH
jgi:hypothetical protein